jgi:hypothetical protein
MVNCQRQSLNLTGRESVHDFGAFVYLDLHKTGSTYVSSFLTSCCLLPEVRFAKHESVKGDYRPESFYFITIRHPLSMWSSLYRYGLERKGFVYVRISEAGLTSCYEDFDKFVSFCLEPENAIHLGEGYTFEISQQIGFMSFRYLALSLHKPHEAIHQSLSTSLPLEKLNSHFITSLEIKNEELVEAMWNFSHKTFPQHFDRAKAAKFLEQNTRMNVSKLKTTEITGLQESTLDLLYTKEHLILSRYETDYFS